MNKFEELIRALSPMLKPMGFSKKGNSFYLEAGKNCGVLNFQKSLSTTKNKIKFTINYGIYSGALKVFDNFDVKSRPTISVCHWKNRVGFLLPKKQDYWWVIDDSVPLSELLTEIKSVLIDLAIPEIRKYLSDESLEKSWAEGVSEGLTKQQMYLYLIVLLKTNNKPELNSKVEELIGFSTGKPFFNNVKECLAILGITVLPLKNPPQ